jgi:hypothetical protein
MYEVFRPAPSGAAAQPPQGEDRITRSQCVETWTVDRYVRPPAFVGIKRSNEATIPGARTTAEPGRSDQLVQFIDPALAMLDPVQCMLDMSGMLDFGTPDVV